MILSSIMVKLAIIGATGAVGIEAITILNNSEIPYDDLKLFASKSSVGKKFTVRNKNYFVKELDETSFNDIDYAILAVSADLARQYVKWRNKNKSECVFIDNSCAFRMVPDVPLIIPEINFDAFKGQNIIANPNCSTIIMLMVLAPLHKQNQIKQIDLSTYQAASGGGLSAMSELVGQVESFVNDEKMDTTIFGRQYLFNAFSHNSEIDMESKFNGEEIKIINETKKILNIKKHDLFSQQNYTQCLDICSYFITILLYTIVITIDYTNFIRKNMGLLIIYLMTTMYLLYRKKQNNTMIINPTCVRIPTLRSHMESITVTFKHPNSERNIKMILEKSPGVRIYDFPEENRFPEPLITENKNEIYVGRIRKSYHGDSHVFHMLVSGDQIRKGAALNALQIYDKIVKMN